VTVAAPCANEAAHGAKLAVAHILYETRCLAALGIHRSGPPREAALQTSLSRRLVVSGMRRAA